MAVFPISAYCPSRTMAKPMFGATRKTAQTAPPPQPSRDLVARGAGFSMRDPDMMSMHLSVEERGTDQQTVTTNLLLKAKKLKAAVDALSFKFKTQPSVSMSKIQKYDNQTGEHNVVGHKASYTLSVTEEGNDPDLFTSHAAEITNAGKKSGAEVNGPIYDLTPALRQEAQLEADGNAYDNAVQTAQNIAYRGGFEIGATPRHTIIGEQTPSYQRRGGATAQAFRMSAESMGGGDATPDLFAFQPIVVQAQPVEVVFDVFEPKQEQKVKVQPA